jgi:peptidylprolyl isomerase
LRRQRQQEATQAYVAGMLDAETVTVDGKVLSQLLQQTQ